MPTIKCSVSNVEEIQARQVAARQGLSLSEVVRRGLQHVISSASSYVDNAEAIVDAQERRNGGKRVVSAMLSPPLSGAIRRLAVQSGRTESHIVRRLLRSELRRLGLLPDPLNPVVATAQDVA